ncbi:MAG: FmdB family zinc ribbon protein [Hyphomicrobiales bacterium]
MPIFEYTCEKCDYRFDRLVLRADSHVKCPLCQSQVKKLFSSFAVGHAQASVSSPQESVGPKLCRNC